MKKNNLKKLALLGLTGGIILGATSCEPASRKNSQIESQKTLTAAELYAQLSPDAQRDFDRMDKEGKDLALKLANQTCAGKNSCKGLNSCANNEHTCKGQGSCKGTSKGPFENKDDAVKVAAMHMTKKRMEMTK